MEQRILEALAHRKKAISYTTSREPFLSKTGGSLYACFGSLMQRRGCTVM